MKWVRLHTNGSLSGWLCGLLCLFMSWMHLDKLCSPFCDVFYCLIELILRTLLLIKLHSPSSVVGPSLSLALQSFPRIVSNYFSAHLKTFLFRRTGIESAYDA